MDQSIPSNPGVIICGGGLAGLTLARQLKITIPSIHIVVLEKNRFPFPPATWKVGESTVEIAANYLKDVLQLGAYFKNNQLTKLGLRYFLGDPTKCISERTEIGLSTYPPYDSFQIDRGLFETDLWNILSDMGIELVDNISVDDITITDGHADNTVTFRDLTTDKTKTLSARWIVDAMGRRNFLQRKFQLKISVDENRSSAWFRVKGKFDYTHFVPTTNTEWHKRVPLRARYYSTTHFVGKGYWVWVIPLSSGNTSLGIVTHEKIHPIITYSSKHKAIEWLRRFEPKIAEHLEGFDIIDFLAIKNYSYSSKQVFSEQGWACTGESGLFSDPYYSPGSNVIGFGNTMITRMIEAENQNYLDTELINFFNNFIISYNDWLIKTIHATYLLFDNQQVMFLSFVWDVAMGWSFVASQMFNRTFLNPANNIELRKITSKFFVVSSNLKELFVDWVNRSPNKVKFEFIDYLRIPFLHNIFQRNIKKQHEPLDEYKKNEEILEKLAAAIFILAIEDIMPEQLEKFGNYFTVNPEAISLNKAEWYLNAPLIPSAEQYHNPVLDQLRAVIMPQELKKRIDQFFNFTW